MGLEKRKRGGRFPRFNAKFHVNVRFEAIDALELHYQVPNVWPSIKSHQNLELAKKARDRMLQLCGFDTSALEENERHQLSDPSNQLISAVVAYKTIDPYGRLVGFVFNEGNAPPISTAEKNKQYLKKEEILKSINATLLKEGLVFPTFYGGLYHQHRKTLIENFEVAREEKKGIWENYSSRLLLPRKPSISDIETPIMLPKVYRRLITHVARNGSISNFRSSLSGNEDTVVDTKNIELTDLSKLLKYKKITETEYELIIKRNPEEMIFKPG